MIEKKAAERSGEVVSHRVSLSSGFSFYMEFHIHAGGPDASRSNAAPDRAVFTPVLHASEVSISLIYPLVRCRATTQCTLGTPTPHVSLLCPRMDASHVAWVTCKHCIYETFMNKR